MPQISPDFQFFVGLATAAAVLLLAVLAVYLLVRQWHRLNRRSTGLRFSGRQALTLDQFYERYYASKKFPRNVVMDVVVRFSNATHTPAKFVKPEDSFLTLGSEHHADCEQFAVDTAVAIREAEQRFGVSLFEGNLVTLDDYVRTTVLAERRAGKRSSR